MRFFLATALLTAVAASPAHAAVVTKRDGAVRVIDGGGEKNAVTVDARPGFVLVRDAEATLRPGAGCRRAAMGAVRCSGAERIEADLGAGADGLLVFARGRAAVRAVDASTGGGNDSVLLAYGGDVDTGPGRDAVLIRSKPVARDSSLHGGPGPDELTGGEGDDTLDGGPGTDVIDGSGGRDLLTYAGRRKPVRVDLERRGKQGQRGEKDSVASVEDIQGGRGNDRLSGDGNANRIVGAGGADRLRGRGGADRLEVSAFDRAISCEGGTDRLLYEPGRGLLPGPVIDRSCERLEGRYATPGGDTRRAALDPVPRSSSGRLEFRLFRFQRGVPFAATRPGEPFAPHDLEFVQRRRVRLDVPASAKRVRAVLGFADPLAWRFRAG